MRVKPPLSTPLLLPLSTASPGRAGLPREVLALRVPCSWHKAAQPWALRAPERVGVRVAKGAGALCTAPVPTEALSWLRVSVALVGMGLPAGVERASARAEALAAQRLRGVGESSAVGDRAARKSASRALLAVRAASPLLQAPETEPSVGEAPVPASSSRVR